MSYGGSLPSSIYASAMLLHIQSYVGCCGLLSTSSLFGSYGGFWEVVEDREQAKQPTLLDAAREEDAASQDVVKQRSVGAYLGSEKCCRMMHRMVYCRGCIAEAVISNICASTN